MEPTATLDSAPTEAPTTRRRSSRPVWEGLAHGIFSPWAGWLAWVGLVLCLVMPPVGWSNSMCSLQKNTGIPCPGCGMTRAVSSTLHGKLGWSVGFHPMGPLTAAGLVAVSVIGILPRRLRNRIVDPLVPYDRIIGIILAAYFVALIGYGFYRIGMVANGNPDFQWWRQPAGSKPPFIT